MWIRFYAAALKACLPIMTRFFFNVFCWILLDWVLGMFTEEFAILGKIPLKIVRIKSQQTKSNFKWWFGSLSQSFFSSATQIIIRFCTGPNHHYFPSDRLYSLIGVITSLATLWLVRLSLTLQCWLVVWLFSIMDFQMSLQSACMRRCIIALVAFVWLFFVFHV